MLSILFEPTPSSQVISSPLSEDSHGQLVEEQISHISSQMDQFNVLVTEDKYLEGIFH